MPTDEVLQRQRELLQRIRSRFRLPERKAYQQVADVLGIKNRSSIHGWEAGRNSISEANLAEIAKKLNTTEAKLTEYLNGQRNLDDVLPLEPQPNNLQAWLEDAIAKLPLLTPRQRRQMGQELLRLIALDLDQDIGDNVELGNPRQIGRAILAISNGQPLPSDICLTELSEMLGIDSDVLLKLWSKTNGNAKTH